MFIRAFKKLKRYIENKKELNKVVDKLSCGDGVQNFEPRELNTTDLKNLSDTIDKASITLGVNQRHSKKVKMFTFITVTSHTMDQWYHS